MAILTDTTQESDPSSTPKRHNSGDTSKPTGPNDTVVSPEPNNNKRTKIRFDDVPMDEGETADAAKKPAISASALRIRGMAAKAAVQKKGGAATPGAATGGATTKF